MERTDGEDWSGSWGGVVVVPRRPSQSGEGRFSANQTRAGESEISDCGGPHVIARFQPSPERAPRAACAHRRSSLKGNFHCARLAAPLLPRCCPVAACIGLEQAETAPDTQAEQQNCSSAPVPRLQWASMFGT